MASVASIRERRNANGDSGASITGLAAGTYTVTATDANGCTATASVTVGEPTAVEVATVAVNAACNGEASGSAPATAQGGTPGYTYAWSNGDSGASITGLAAGTYTVTATDANGCTATASVTVGEPTAVEVATVAVDAACNGDASGSATATASGGTPGYSYTWSNGAEGAIGGHNPLKFVCCRHIS